MLLLPEGSDYIFTPTLRRGIGVLCKIQPLHKEHTAVCSQVSTWSDKVGLPTVLSIRYQVPYRMEFTVISRFFVFLQVWFLENRYDIAVTAPRYVKVPNRAVDMDSRALPACYPRGNFWLMIFVFSTKSHRFTKFCFRNCSTYPSRSKASFCLCTTTPISIRS